MLNRILILAIFTLTLFLGCGRRSSGGQSANEADTFGMIEPHLAGGLNVVVEPFFDASLARITVETDALVQNSTLANIAVIPGVHWQWNVTLPATIAQSNGSQWSSSAFVKNSAIAAPFRVQYAADLNAASRLGWPAIGGGVSGTNGVTTAASFLFLKPENLGTPIRVWFRLGTAPVPIFHSGKSCGENCIDFANWAEAIETPISYAQDYSSRFFVGAEADLPFDVTLDSTAGVDVAWLRGEVEAARIKLRQAWSFLTSKWGVPAIGSAFRVHLFVQSGCRLQALEHDSSVLVSVGLCSALTFRQRLVEVVVHEMVHVWNARHIFPKETAVWNPYEFSASRLNQLFFYEGVTEGFARIAVSQLFSEYRDAQMIKWNSSVTAISNSGMGRTLSEISASSPSLGYDVGAYLALWLAGKVRAVNGSDVELSKARFWEIIPTLKTTNSGGAFDISVPIASKKCVSKTSFEPCAGGSVGYSFSDLLAAMQNALQLSGWNLFAQSHLSGVFIANQTELDSSVAEVSAAAGVQVQNVSGKSAFPASVSAQMGVWPF